MKKKIITILLTISFIFTLYIEKVYGIVNFDKFYINNVMERKASGKPVNIIEKYSIITPNLKNEVGEYEEGYILIGDSRTAGFDLTSNINNTKDNWFVIACSGQGFDFMAELAVPMAERLEEANPNIEHWNYIICLGVNDLENRDKYFNYLTKFSCKKNVFFVSVNPINENQELVNRGLSNDYIDAFNYHMTTLENVEYIDTYHILKAKGYNTESDGLHYTILDTQMIYNMIKMQVEQKVAKLKLETKTNN